MNAGAAPAAASVSELFRETVFSGSLVLALPLALLAGLVSFLSPCVLPLVPGYLSYVTGLVGVDLAATRGRRQRSRLVLGSALFVLGFSVVFVSFGALFGSVGALLVTNRRLITSVLGVLTVLLGLAFLGALPFFQRELRVHRRPAVGLLGAPMLGVLFGLGWTPCIGPTLGAILGLSVDAASAGRGALLAAAYCVGLGLPFLAVALAYRRALGAIGWMRRHSIWVVRLGGAMLVTIGVLLLTGTWAELVRHLQGWVSGFEPVV